MDKRVIVGIVVVLLIGVVAISMLNQPSQEPPNGDNGDNGGNGGNGDNGGAITVSPSLQGIVQDNSGNPLEGVQIKIGSLVTETSENGSYFINVTLGSYVIEAIKKDYTKGIKSLKIEDNITYTADFSLKYNPSTTGEGQILKIITRHSSDILTVAENSFLKSDAAKEYNISDIAFIPLGATLWVDTIPTIGDIDVAWGGGPVLFDVVNNAGLLAPLDDPSIFDTLEDIPYLIGGVPTRRVDGDNVYWIGSAISSFGFTVNTRTLSSLSLPEPLKWIDLANETYSITLPDPIIGTADAISSTSNTRMFTIILQAYGWQDGWNLLIRKGANSKIYDQSGNVRDAVIRGDIGVGTTIDFYGYTAQMQNPEFCKYIMPQDGTIVNADPIALLTTSTKPSAAQAFISWVLSSEGQKIWLEPTINRMPINPEVFETPEGLERSDLAEVYELTKETLIINFSDDLALSYESAMMNFYHAVIVRPQLTLVDVWMDMTIALDEGDITKEQFLYLVEKLGNPHLIEFVDPDSGETINFNQEYAQSINERVASDAGYKSILVDIWTPAAETHYNNIKTEINDLIS